MHRKTIDFDKMTRRFLTEGQVPSVASFIQSLEEVIGKLRPNTRTDERRVEIAKSHLKEIRRSVRRLQNEVTLLQEKLQVLEEGKGSDEWQALQQITEGITEAR